MALVIKNPPACAGDIRDAGSVPRSGRSSGGRNGNPLQCHCQDNPMDREAWRATVHGVTNSRTRLNDQHLESCLLIDERFFKNQFPAFSTFSAFHKATVNLQFSSVAQLCPTLRPHESQHARPPCPSPTPGVHSDSHPLSQ